jgi:hypothetical protein
VISARKDERAIEAAWKQNAVVLGYDMDEKPWLWPDDVPVMQGIVLGMTGSGKTTLLKNIISQDIARFAGPPEERHRIPMVIFDGKVISNSSMRCCRTFTARAACISSDY